MKGPGFRRNLDVRRVWRCPSCAQEVRLAGDVVTFRCRACADHPWMQIATERNAVPRPMSLMSAPEIPVANFQLTPEELAKPLEGRVRRRGFSRMGNDGPPPEAVNSAAAADSSANPAMQEPGPPGDNRSHRESRRPPQREPARSHSPAERELAESGNSRLLESQDHAMPQFGLDAGGTPPGDPTLSGQPQSGQQPQTTQQDGLRQDRSQQSRRQQDRGQQPGGFPPSRDQRPPRPRGTGPQESRGPRRERPARDQPRPQQSPHAENPAGVPHPPAPRSPRNQSDDDGFGAGLE